MKIKWVIALTAIFFFTTNVMAQTPFVRSADPKDPSVTILKGLITKYILINDPAFKWYAPAHDGFVPDSAVVNDFSNHSGNIHFVLFGGTWCDDTQYILPRFFNILEKSAVPDSAVTFFGVDRDKKTLGGISDALHITNVPTIIIFKEGKEIGRVVEYGTTGKWDAEVASILKQSEK
jgi:thiol-disulfide isomerase/thioredoxin